MKITIEDFDNNDKTIIEVKKDTITFTATLPPYDDCHGEQSEKFKQLDRVASFFEQLDTNAAFEYQSFFDLMASQHHKEHETHTPQQRQTGL